MISLYLIVFIISVLLSLVATRLCIWLSYKINFLDVPLTISRKNHSKSTPLLGGTAVFFSFFLIIFFTLISAYEFKDTLINSFPFLNEYINGAMNQNKKLMFIFIGGFLIYLIGLKDDKDGMQPFTKLITIFLVSLLLFYLDIKITFFIKSNILTFCMTLMWILFLTNSLNLLDNMDGLCSGVSITCSITMLAVSLILEQYFISLYLIAFIGVLLGFFYFNFGGGKIFLGDSGALFIGYNLAVITILESFYISGKSNIASIFMPAFIFAVPLYDTLSVIIIRILNKVPIYKGDLNHISHRINRAGYSRKTTVVIIFILSLLSGVSSLVFIVDFNLNIYQTVFSFIILILSIWLSEFLIKITMIQFNASKQ